MKDARALIEQYLGEAKLMSIATSKGNRPWVASVWYVHDKDWNLYFISRKSTRHSIELKGNSHVAGTITKPHTIGSGEKVRGLQFEGTARACTWKELKMASDLYVKKYRRAERIPLSMLRMAKFIATYYVIKPKSIVLFDEINFPKEHRQEVRLR